MIIQKETALQMMVNSFSNFVLGLEELGIAREHAVQTAIAYLPHALDVVMLLPPDIQVIRLSESKDVL